MNATLGTNAIVERVRFIRRYQFGLFGITFATFVVSLTFGTAGRNLRVKLSPLTMVLLVNPNFTKSHVAIHPFCACKLEETELAVECVLWRLYYTGIEMDR